MADGPLATAVVEEEEWVGALASAEVDTPEVVGPTLGAVEQESTLRVRRDSAVARATSIAEARGS